jgi:hypothetical protein
MMMSEEIQETPWTWRKAINKSGLQASTRHVLLVLSCYVNDMAEAVFPSIDTLVEMSGLSKRSVITHLQLAEAAGFIVVRKHGYGDQRWARNEYYPQFPTEKNRCAQPVSDEKGSATIAPPLEKTDEKVVQILHEGGANFDKKVVQPLHPNSPIEILKNSRERARGKNEKIIFSDFVKTCAEKKEDCIPADHHVFQDAEDIGVSQDWVRLAWRWFFNEYRGTRALKRYTFAGWREQFAKAVEQNWPRYWSVLENGECVLNTAGRSAQAVVAARQERAAQKVMSEAVAAASETSAAVVGATV